MKKVFKFVLASLMLFSCARSFHTINPAIYNFDNNKVLAEDINISYKYGCQELAQNKPYSRKERIKNIKLISIKIENQSNSEVTINKDNFVIKTASGRDIVIISSEEYSKAIRQYSETFALFYGLAGITYLSITTPEGKTTTEWGYNPIPLVIGLGNAIFAEVANSNQKKNLALYNIFGKTIMPNSTIYGLLAINETSFPELNFVLYK